MTETRAVVVGAGSIGIRHARVLRDLGADVAVVSRRGGEAGIPGVEVLPDAAAAVAALDPDYAVVATETADHAGAALRLAEAGFSGRLLVEKPLAVDPAGLAGFESVAVAFNLRFHPVIRALEAALAGRAAFAVDVYCGQHLDSWRPGREGAATYSGSRDAGGGVLRDLSHELDYLTALFGRWTGVAALGGRVGDVTVDSDDAWGIVSSLERAHVVTTQLNYLDAVPARRVRVVLDGETLEADVVAGTLRSAAGVEDFTVDRDASYRAMHEAVLAGAPGAAGVADAAEVDALIADIERSSREHRWVER